MALSWAQRLSQISRIIGTDAVTDDENRQGQALDEYLSKSSHGQADQNQVQVNKLRFTDGDLSLIGKLAVGQFGMIDVVRCRLDSRVYVRKTIEKRTAIRTRGQCSPMLERQILTLALKRRSAWVPHLLCAFQTDTSLKLIMQYADGGNLWDLIESSPDCKVSETDLRWWIPQMVSAIVWCHSQGFVHRDVKPHNFVLTPTSRLLLVDFGSAAPLLPPTASGIQLIPREYCLVPCGTCDYISPEILECHEIALVTLEIEDDETQVYNTLPREDDLKTYGRETDWWSLGAVMYEMAFGIAPFYAHDIRTTYTKIMNHQTSLKLKESAELSSAGVSLLHRLLCDKKTRLGRHSSVELTEHEFFQYVHWPSLHQKPAPSVLHLPQCTYSEAAFNRLGSEPLANAKEDDSPDSERYSRPFEFSALFQSSNSATGTSLQGTSVLKANVANPLNSFIGFSWGPLVNAFSLNPRLDAQVTVLHREPIDITSRSSLPFRMMDHSTVPESAPASHPFRTPIRPSFPNCRAMSGGPRTIGTDTRYQGRRPLTDREAMQLLVDCVEMSARKKVLESGRKPKYILRGSIQNNPRPIPDPIFTTMVMKKPMSTASSEIESQPPSPSPRPGSALSRKSGRGGQSSTFLLQGRSTPTLTSTFTSSGLLKPINNSSISTDGLGRIPVYEQKLMEAEERHERLLEDLSMLERNIGEISLRLSQRQ